MRRITHRKHTKCWSIEKRYCQVKHVIGMCCSFTGDSLFLARSDIVTVFTDIQAGVHLHLYNLQISMASVYSFCQPLVTVGS